MPRLRKRNAPPVAPAQLELKWAICATEYRPAAVGVLYRLGEQRPIDDPAVQRNPEFWKGLIDLVEPEGVK